MFDLQATSQAALIVRAKMAIDHFTLLVFTAILLAYRYRESCIYFEFSRILYFGCKGCAESRGHLNLMRSTDVFGCHQYN